MLIFSYISRNLSFLQEAQKLQEYGIIFNKVSKYKKDKRGSFSLGISVRGLIVYEERGIVKSPTFRHPWQNIKRMAFHRRRFFIEAHGDPETSKMVLYTCSYKKSRYLLKMCTSFYKFQMMMGMKLSSLKEYPKDGGKMKFILTIMYFKNSVFNVIEVSFTKVVTVCCRQQLH
ncbi:FERM domain-containing protein 6-like [Orbicella faveolata]|uniref:FERM domain-containing protein 6-like n=1 Tax=Orbicella faveolata TaxID=48498 RepID=UPI0009E5C65D|nr:FERM domain-containing protein 6-like [Orbicella faveolata]